MEKIVLVFMCIVLFFSLCSCKEKDIKNNTKNNTESNAASLTVSGETQSIVKQEEPKKEQEDVLPYEWKEIEGGIEITKYLGNEKAIVVPEIIENKKVVSVGNAFSGNVMIEKLILPKSCETVNVKNCDNLKYLDYPGYKTFGTFTLKTLPFSSFPKSLETLILSGATGSVDFGYLAFNNWGGLTNLKYLDLSSASAIYGNGGVYRWMSLPFELNIPQMKYYLASSDDCSYSGGVFDSGSLDPTYQRETAEITTDNFSAVMCEVLGAENVKVNGNLCTK